MYLNKIKISFAILITAFVFGGLATAQVENRKQDQPDKFRQLDESWPTANDRRLASGEPGPDYWQQRADYDIEVELNDRNQSITGSETITYTNNSPHTLKYIWVRLDQNRYVKHSDDHATIPASSSTRMSFGALEQERYRNEFDGGFKISSVTNADGDNMKRSTVGTMMRLDLEEPLEPGETHKFNISWSYNLIESRKIPIKRSGFHHFEKDGNKIYNMGQWYPRVAAYTDNKAWSNRQFLGLGEFETEFGDFNVSITVPSDHVIGATGELQNDDEVLTDVQRARLREAKTADKPVFIITREEAMENQSTVATDKKTWKFRAENVRDFAWGSSRKFVWDAMGHYQESDGRTIMGMSFYPEEGMPLWDQYSTEAVIHTLEVYSKYTFPYPYPVAISINSATSGMEYPMVSFNPPRPTEDENGNRTYSRGLKYGLIGVIIHEVGHTYFPMIVNTPEKDWFWMDEGFNTFLQNLAHREWEEEWPGSVAAPTGIIPFMTSKNQMPVMTDPESLIQFGANAYQKPATAFNILRETVMGREAFDHAFKEYSQRWMFKHPYPADFFRTMEDASGYDLDWFWRGWFYTTDHVDISLDRVVWATVNTKDPDVEQAYLKAQEEAKEPAMIVQRHANDRRRVEEKPELRDFYTDNDQYTVTDPDRAAYNAYISGLEDWEKALLNSDDNYYFLELSNVGGLVMPVIVQIEYEDGTKEVKRYPAEIWRRNPYNVRKMIVSEKEIKSFTLDPFYEIADANVENNHWPRKHIKSRLELFKFNSSRNMMDKAGEGTNYNNN